MEQKINHAIQVNDYATLSSIFSDSSTQSWKILGEGERRTLAAYFVRSVVTSETFLPDAFRSEQIADVIRATLGHLPPSVEGAMDNTLRKMNFEYLVDEGDYHNAAVILAGTRMEESDKKSVYYMTPAARCDVYVKIAESYLEEDETVEADGVVTRAGAVVDSIEDLEENFALILR